MYELYQNPAERIGTTSSLGVQEPWYWFPSPASNWNGLDFATRVGGLKVELPWKIRASIVQSVCAHHGALRSFVVCQNEYTVFTAGVGPGFKGNIQKWDLSRVDCMSSYNGHDEVVNDIFDLASSGRVASCDGIVHIWNGQTGRLISMFFERSLASSTQLAERYEDNMLHFNPLPSGMLSSAFHGNSYTTMDFLGFSDRLIVGQKLHLWRSESVDSGFPPLISSICSSSSNRMSPEESMAFPSWIAAASSTGQCRLFDLRSGKIISSWQAHDGYVTELAATGDYQLVSSSRIWDLRRNWSAEQRVFRGYSDGVSGFSVWGQNIISICRNKIGLSSLQSPANEDGQYRASLQHVYMADEEAKNASMLSAITILPFSLLFLLGTEDDYLKICCVNDIFDLASSGRVASCDGIVHIWNGQTGRLISIGMLSSAFHGNSYTTMDFLGFSDRLIVGTGNGSLRFIDVNQGQKLHLWRSESVDSGFPPLISSICLSSSNRMSPEESMAFPSWIAAASSTGQCRLFDLEVERLFLHGRLMMDM
ncbi:hypothetical protein SASPL_141521 [Salvia splendens]|uniref:Uncharacterized protein n=1 Tax=Salvia splendens TaxID=180675 RepID=A0A8X8ZCY1_SALSN|nr:hypothetical protein SASPL_141521 [Salvia splendens]